MVHPGTVRRATRGDLAIGFVKVIGLATAVAFSYGLAIGVHAPAISMPATPNGVAFLALPAAGLLVTGYYLGKSDLDDPTIWRVGQFAVVGAIAGALLAVVLLGSVALDGVSPGVLFVLLVGSAGEGALLGVVTGLASATREMSTDRRTTNERLVLLHRLIQHNLRNRVNVIDGHLDLMETDEDGPDESAAIVAAQVDAVNDLLEEARLAVTIATTSPGRIAIDLSAMLDRNVAVLEETYRGVSVESHVPKAVHVLAIPGIEAGVENVFDNAVRHNDRDEPTVSVSVDVRGDTVDVTVADDGPGIDDARKETVFEASSGGRHGLGLSLVRELVEESGGEIRIEDESPRGTAVVLSLQRANPGQA